MDRLREECSLLCAHFFTAFAEECIMAEFIRLCKENCGQPPAISDALNDENMTSWCICFRLLCFKMSDCCLRINTSPCIVLLPREVLETDWWRAAEISLRVEPPLCIVTWPSQSRGKFVVANETQFEFYTFVECRM